MDKNLKLLTVAGAALVVVACQPPEPPNASLDHARRVYQFMRSDPWIAQRSADQLTQARQSLRAAERAVAQGGDEATTRTLVQLALHQVELASTLAGQPAKLERDDPAPLLRTPVLPGLPQQARAQQVRLAPTR